MIKNIAFFGSPNILLHSYKSNVLQMYCIAVPFRVLLLHWYIYSWFCLLLNTCMNDCNRKQNRLYRTTSYNYVQLCARPKGAHNNQRNPKFRRKIIVFVTDLKWTFSQFDQRVVHHWCDALPSLHSKRSSFWYKHSFFLTILCIAYSYTTNLAKGEKYKLLSFIYLYPLCMRTYRPMIAKGYKIAREIQSLKIVFAF